jgi:cyclopropane fatty-acyl-phospholipid synthase-like methyltransferase
MSEAIKRDLKKYYDLEAGSRNERPVREWKYRIRDHFLGMAAAEGKSTLLEIGAGTGRDSAYFMNSGFQVTAVDFSAAMV